MDGAPHHASEDIALARVLPGLRLLPPASLEELEAIATEGPFYIRAPRDYVPLLDIPRRPGLLQG